MTGIPAADLHRQSRWCSRAWQTVQKVRPAWQTVQKVRASEHWSRNSRHSLLVLLS